MRFESPPCANGRRVCFGCGVYSRYPIGVYEKEKAAFPVRHIAYAESKDGMTWEVHDIDSKTGSPDDPDRNVVWRGLENERADAPAIIEMPDAKKAGYKFVLLYLDRVSIGCRTVRG